jgi:hypothetical protein
LYYNHIVANARANFKSTNSVKSVQPANTVERFFKLDFDLF